MGEGEGQKETACFLPHQPAKGEVKARANRDTHSCPAQGCKDAKEGGDGLCRGGGGACGGQNRSAAAGTRTDPTLLPCASTKELPRVNLPSLLQPSQR